MRAEGAGGRMGKLAGKEKGPPAIPSLPTAQNVLSFSPKQRTFKPRTWMAKKQIVHGH
jgi:hypothetical protein